MPHLDFNGQDPLEVHLTYELVVDGNVVSSGSTLFCAPKHYHFADPKLSVSVDGDTVTVTAENFAKSVSVETENGVLRLDDNFVDMEAGTKTFRILPTADLPPREPAYRAHTAYEAYTRQQNDKAWKKGTQNECVPFSANNVIYFFLPAFFWPVSV
mgnify:CR=1 FL=1